MTAGRFLWQQVAPSRRAALALLSATLAAVATKLAVPRLLGTFINGVEAHATGTDLRELAAAFLLAAALAPLARYWAGMAGTDLLWQVANRLRERLLATVLSLPGTFHHEHPPGELVERIDGDVSALGSLLAGLSLDLVANGGLVVGALVAIVTVSADLGLLLAALAAMTAGALEYIRRRTVPVVAAERAANGDAFGVFGVFGEVLDARRDLAGVGAEALGRQRFADALGRWQALYVRADLMGYTGWAVALTAFGCMDAAAYLVSGRLVLLGHLPIGTAYTLLAYVALMAGPLEQLRSQIEVLQRAQGSLARVMALSRMDPGGPLAPPRGAAGALAVQLVGVRRRYGANRGIEDVSLSILPGQHVGLVGRSGAGKSTLARLLAGIDAPDAGTITVGGASRSFGTRLHPGTQVGLLPQEPALFSATLRENLTLFDGTIPDDRVAAALEQVASPLATFADGLDQLVDPERLSAGEAQLLCLARVLVRDPGLVILDEPTAQLDPDTARTVSEAVRRALAGRTALVIAHRLDTVLTMDRVIVLDGGRVVEDGVPSVLADEDTTWFHRLLQFDGVASSERTPS